MKPTLEHLTFIPGNAGIEYTKENRKTSVRSIKTKATKTESWTDVIKMYLRNKRQMQYNAI